MNNVNFLPDKIFLQVQEANVIRKEIELLVKDAMKLRSVGPAVYVLFAHVWACLGFVLDIYFVCISQFN